MYLLFIWHKVKLYYIQIIILKKPLPGTVYIFMKVNKGIHVAYLVITPAYTFSQPSESMKSLTIVMNHFCLQSLTVNSGHPLKEYPIVMKEIIIKRVFFLNVIEIIVQLA